MKKIIILFVLFTLVLNGCGQQPSINIDTSTSQLENIGINNEDESEKHHWIVNYNCLPKDEGKGETYNAAIEAYNEFLAKEAKETLECFNDNNEGLTSPLPYGHLKDLHGDGIPEIIVRFEQGYPYRVFSYLDNKVVEIVGPMSNNMHGGCYLHENGIYISNHVSAGATMYIITYNKDGTQTIEEFFTDTLDVYIYKRCTVSSVTDLWDIKEEEYYILEGEQQYHDMLPPYETSYKYENEMDLGESYSPYIIEE